MIKILYDGWPLINGANSPEALHLLSLLRQRHPEVSALVAIPDEPPAWLPEGVAAHVQTALDTPGARLAWEQRSLPRMQTAFGADLLHLTTRHPPLLGNTVRVVSPAEYPRSDQAPGLMVRLREAMASGGMSRTRGLLWPSDLSALEPMGDSMPVYHLPIEPYPDKGTIADQQSAELAALDLPEEFILYHGPGDPRSLRSLLDAWSWAAGPIGEQYPLLILGLDSAVRRQLQNTLSDLDFEDSVHPLTSLHPDTIPILVQRCAAVFHPAPLSPWGGTVRLALAYGKPLVAADSALADTLVGAGAYLLPGGDTRALGAALITVIVEDTIAERLSQAGAQRATAWDHRPYGDELFAVYQSILAAGGKPS